MCRRGRTIGTASADIISEAAEVDGFIPYPVNLDLPAILSLILRLRRMGFSRAVYADSSGVSERILKRYIYLMRAGGISNLIGFHPHNPQNRPVAPYANSYPQKSEALLRLDNLARDGIDVSVESDLSSSLLVLPAAVLHEAKGWLRERRSRLERPLIGICPGAASPANIWPVERFIEVGRRLMQLDRYEIVVCGGRAERTIGDRMIAEWGQGINAAGHLPVLGSAAILQDCMFMVGLDSGTTHLSAAVGVPCVTLQGGRMLPGYWDPLGTGHIIVRYPVNCVGCCRTSCVTPKHPCMRGITVETVWQAVLKMQERLTGTGTSRSSGPNANAPLETAINAPSTCV
ncbi:MAG: glycosyltransferase family 9 protein [Acidobacteriota bacterium]